MLLLRQLSFWGLSFFMTPLMAGEPSPVSMTESQFVGFYPRPKNTLQLCSNSMQKAYEEKCADWKKSVEAAFESKITKLELECGPVKVDANRVSRFKGSSQPYEDAGVTVTFNGKIRATSDPALLVVTDAAHDEPIFTYGVKSIDRGPLIYATRHYIENRELLCTQEKQRVRDEMEAEGVELTYVGCTPRNGAQFISTPDSVMGIIGYTPVIQLAILIRPPAGMRIQTAAHESVSASFVPELTDDWSGEFEAVKKAHRSSREVQKADRIRLRNVYSQNGLRYVYTAFDSEEEPEARDQWVPMGGSLGAKVALPGRVLYFEKVGGDDHVMAK